MICPNGHTSVAEDFCDTCGAAIDPTAQPAAPAAPEAPDPQAGATEPGEPGTPGGPPAADQTCPHCQTVNPLDALFCEACGYDFTTGALPRGAEPVAPPASGGPVTGSLDLDAPTPDGVSAEGAAPEGGASPATGGTGIPPRIPLEWVAEVWIDPDWYAGQEAEEPMPSPGLPAVVPLTTRSILVGRVSASRNIHPDIDCAADTGVSRRHAQLTTDGSRWFVEDLASSNGTFVGPASGPLPDDPIAVGPRTELDLDDRVYVGAWTRIVVRRATDDEREAGAA